jgi:segregation and condensation protein B
VTPLAQLLEAALFSAARPLTVEELGTLDPEATLADVRVALEQIREHFDFEQHGVELLEIAGGYQFLTRPVHAAAIERAQFSVRTPKLTAAALETLAVIAYRQPVSRSRVAAVRGVNVDGVIRTQHTRGHIEEMGHDEESTAILYGTTSYFLERLGLQSLDDLPALAPYLPEVDVLDEIAEGGRG